MQADRVGARYVDIVEGRRRAIRELLPNILGERARFVLEIGCGHGHFLTAYGAANPESLCIGIDIERDRIARGERKRTRARLENVRFVRADAVDFLESLPTGVRVCAIFVLFPDPWPKRRHHKNRLMRRGFLERLAGLSEPGAKLYLRTDYSPYFDEADAELRACGSWTIVDEPWPFELETVFQARAPAYRSLVAARRP